MEPLKCFYVVTTTSLYTVEARLTEAGRYNISAIKYAQRAATYSRLPVNSALFQKTERIFISTYHALIAASNTESFENIPHQFWDGRTSSLVALFLDRAQAILCLESEGLQELDERWKTETIETLRAIGLHHPVFKIQTQGKYAFPSDWVDLIVQ